MNKNSETDSYNGMPNKCQNLYLIVTLYQNANSEMK